MMPPRGRLVVTLEDEVRLRPRNTTGQRRPVACVAAASPAAGPLAGMRLARSLSLAGLLLGEVSLGTAGAAFRATGVVRGGLLAVTAPDGGEVLLSPVGEPGPGLLLADPASPGKPVALLHTTGGALIITPTGPLRGLVRLELYRDESWQLNSLESTLTSTGELALTLRGAYRDDRSTESSTS